MENYKLSPNQVGLIAYRRLLKQSLYHSKAWHTQWRLYPRRRIRGVRQGTLCSARDSVSWERDVVRKKQFLVPTRSCLCVRYYFWNFLEVVRDTTVVSRSSRYSGHDRHVRCICYYETWPFLLLAHKRPSPFFYTYPHKKTLFYTLSTAREANFGGSAIICPIPNPAIAPGAKIAFINSEKLFWVSTICAQILGFSRIYWG